MTNAIKTLRERVLAGSGEDRGEWITVDVDRALIVDRGRTTILCDRLPSPVTLVLKFPARVLLAALLSALIEREA